MLSRDPERADPTIIINIKPMNIGLFRLMHQLTGSLKMMKERAGMTDSDLDELKAGGILSAVLVQPVSRPAHSYVAGQTGAE